MAKWLIGIEVLYTLPTPFKRIPQATQKGKERIKKYFISLQLLYVSNTPTPRVFPQQRVPYLANESPIDTSSLRTQNRGLASNILDHEVEIFRNRYRYRYRTRIHHTYYSILRFRFADDDFGIFVWD